MVEVQTIKSDLYFISIFLMKKSIIQIEYIYKSLIDKQDIFNKEGFKDFLNSSYYEERLNTFEEDSSNFQRYLSYLLEMVFEEKFKKDYPKRLQIFHDESLSMSDINKIINSHYLATFKKTLDIFPKTDLYHEYVLMLVSIYYSVNCEKFFPFKIGKAKFEWIAFYDLHEKMTDQELFKIIN